MLWDLYHHHLYITINKSPFDLRWTEQQNKKTRQNKTKQNKRPKHRTPQQLSVPIISSAVINTTTAHSQPHNNTHT
jgi:hypothetical protein